MATLHRGTFRLVLSLLCALALAGCAKQTIDGSSEEAFRASIARMAKELPADKRDQFQKSVGLVTVKNMDLPALFNGLKDGKQPDKDYAKGGRAALDGKNVDEVIAMAAAIRAELAAKQAAIKANQPPANGAGLLKAPPPAAPAATGSAPAPAQPPAATPAPAPQA